MRFCNRMQLLWHSKYVRSTGQHGVEHIIIFALFSRWETLWRLSLAAQHIQETLLANSTFSSTADSCALSTKSQNPSLAASFGLGSYVWHPFSTATSSSLTSRQNTYSYMYFHLAHARERWPDSSGEFIMESRQDS